MPRLFVDWTGKAVRFLELFLAGMIIAGVLVSSLDLLVYMRDIHVLLGEQAYSTLHSFLGHILLLVVGLEIALTLVRHSAFNIVDVILYTAARKLLIFPATTLELLFGAMAIAVLFTVKRYLYSHRPEQGQNGHPLPGPSPAASKPLLADKEAAVLANPPA